MFRGEDNQKLWQEGHNFCVKHAAPHDLEHEVVQMYKEWTRGKVLSRAEYMQHASDALYEWDI